MKKNTGTIDRIARIVLALVFVGLYFGGIVTGTLGIVLLVLAGVFAATAIVSFCPLYVIFGFSSCPAKKE